MRHLNKIEKNKFVYVFIILILCIAFFGCGGSGGGGSDLSDSDSQSFIRVYNLKGKVITPQNESSLRSSIRTAYFPLISTAGTKVFIENNSSLFAYADADGNFIIQNVPEGQHRVVADILSGTTYYRQVSDYIAVSGDGDTKEVSSPIELSPALYSLKIHVSDIENSSPVAAKINLWGFSFDTINGIADIGPFPSTNKSIDLKISAIGYKDLNTFINFGENYKSEIYVNMTSTTSTDSNRAPVVEILNTNAIVKTDEDIQLSGIGSDPDGDIISWKWSADAGTFINDINQNTVYHTPKNAGTVIISLTGSDSKGATGKSVLNLNIQQGLNPPEEPSEPDPEPQNHSPLVPSNPSPADLAVAVSENVNFSWNGGDPDDGDVVTYQVFLATISTKITSTPTNMALIKTTNELSFSYNGLEKDATYQWQVIATDKSGAKTSGAVWSFSTVKTENIPPSMATIVEPQDGATEISIYQKLRWSATDENGDKLKYDVYFGTESDPPIVSSSQENPIFDPGILTNATTYYWRIVVSDGQTSNSDSSIWSFTTEETTIIKPHVVSITAPSSITDSLRIEFSETIYNKSKEAEAFSFSPAVSGTWSWSSSDKVAEFSPDGGKWLPGSYNKFTLTANVLENASGDKVEKSEEEKFVLPSDLTIPEGYHSYAFPMNVPANTTVTISVPDLAENKKVYMAAIADGDPIAPSFRASQFLRKSIDGNSRIDYTSQIRKLEKELIKKPIPAPKKNNYVSLKNVGDIRNFHIYSVATSSVYPNNVLSTKLAATSNNTFVYIDENITDSDSTKQAFAQNVINVFDNNILNVVREYFGDEPEEGVDNEKEIKIVAVDIKIEGLCGFFYTPDLYENDSGYDGLKDSNQGKIFYVNYNMRSYENLFYATLAHEFQHMINFYQKNTSLSPYTYPVMEENWINEGLSMYSEELCGYSLNNNVSEVATSIKGSMQNNHLLSLTYWPDTSLSSECYGQVYLFMHFLAHPGRYNAATKTITQSLTKGNGQSLIGEANIEAVTHESFDKTIAKWVLSLFLNKYDSSNPEDYAIHNINLKGNYGGVKLPGYTINNIDSEVILDDLPHDNSFRLFEKKSNGSDNTTFTVTSGNQPVTLWLLDDRE